jgi:hypothetical protein
MGLVFGDWTVIKRLPNNVSRNGSRVNAVWLVRCSCGTERGKEGGLLRFGASKSCGCKIGNKTATRMIQHGHTTIDSASPTYRSWSHAKARCFNETDDNYPNYGGRGISMCQEWADSFGAFLSYMGTRPDGLSLDRIDNNGNYEPGNCRWATPLQQSNNQRKRKRAQA